MALTICAWCGGVLKEGVGPVSHGLCAKCAEGLLAQQRDNLERFLELFDEPVALVDDTVTVVATNSAMRKVANGLGEGEVVLKGGALLGCANAAVAGECSRAPQCAACTIRTSVVETHKTGAGVSNRPVLLDRVSGGERNLRISTEKIGQLVLLKVAGLAQTEAPAT